MQLAVLRPNGALPGDKQPAGQWLHVAAEVGGRIVGACTVGPSVWEHKDITELAEPPWQLRSMAVLPEFRGGTGSALLTAAVSLASASGAASLWANARVEALGLYLRQGWAVVGPEWVKPGIGPHRWIVLHDLSMNRCEE